MTGIRSQVFTVASQAPYYWAIAVHRCTSLYIAVHTIFVNGPEPWVQPPTASNTFSDGFVSFNVIISAYRAANHGNPGNQRTYTYMYDFFSTGLRRKSTNTCITVIPIHVSLKLWLYDASRGFRGVWVIAYVFIVGTVTCLVHETSIRYLTQTAISQQ